jgi:hypothetical protein
MARDIIFSANNNEEVIILPVVPEIDLDNPQNNERFETINSGTLNLIGDKGLRSFSITSILPSQEYKWLRPGSLAEPFKYINFFDKWIARKVPIRVVTSKVDGSEWFNMPCLIDNFSHKIRKNGNVEYSLEVSEYGFIQKGVS